MTESSGPYVQGADIEADSANAKAMQRIGAAEPFLVDLKPAGEVIPDLGERDLLHAGPPLSDWTEACGALRGSIAGALVHWGSAQDVPEAEALASGGDFRLLPANDHHALATYAGVISRRTPVLVVRNRATGNRAFAALNEGRGRALRYGSNDAETLARLAWLEGEFAQMLGTAIRLSEGIDVFGILVQALHMGDDGHSRHKAASALFVNAIAPYLIEAGFGRKETAHALRFMADNEIFFLPLTMAAAKSAMESAEGIPGSTVVTCMAANGLRFGHQGEWSLGAVEHRSRPFHSWAIFQRLRRRRLQPGDRGQRDCRNHGTWRIRHVRRSRACSLCRGHTRRSDAPFARDVCDYSRTSSLDSEERRLRTRCDSWPTTKFSFSRSQWRRPSPRWNRRKGSQVRP